MITDTKHVKGLPITKIVHFPLSFCFDYSFNPYKLCNLVLIHIFYTKLSVCFHTIHHIYRFPWNRYYSIAVKPVFTIYLYPCWIMNMITDILNKQLSYLLNNDTKTEYNTQLRNCTILTPLILRRCDSSFARHLKWLVHVVKLS